MPVKKDPQLMVEPGLPREGYSGACGYRSDKILMGSFPNSPIMWSNNPDVILTDKFLTDEYRELLNGEINDGFQFPTTVYMDYNKNGSPSMSDVTVGGDGSGNPTMATNIDKEEWPVPNLESSTGSPNASGGYSVGANFIN